MDTIDTNHVNMIQTTVDFCNSNTSATAGIPAFAPVVTTVENKLVLIAGLDAIAMATTKGVTLDTKNLKRVMIDIALKVAKGAFAYASSINNQTLKSSVDYSFSDLNELKKEEADDICQSIHDTGNANAGNISNFGVNATDISDLQTAINLYGTAVQNPRQAVINKKDAKAQIKRLIREITLILFKEQMDAMCYTLKTSNVNFFNKYFLAREVIDLGKGTTRLKFKVVKASTDTRNPAPLPVEGALIHINEADVDTKTDINGEAIIKIKRGTYTGKITKTGFQDIIIETFEIKQGETKSFTFTMIPVI